eukprot:68473_1
MTSLYNKNMSDTKQHTTTTDDPDKLFKLIIDTLNEKEMENENSKINKECMIKLIEENNLNFKELLTEHEREHEEERCNINMNSFDFKNKIQIVCNKIIEEYNTSKQLITKHILTLQVFKEFGIENAYKFEDIQNKVHSVICKQFQSILLENGYNNIQYESKEQIKLSTTKSKSICGKFEHNYTCTPDSSRLICTKCSSQIFL